MTELLVGAATRALARKSNRRQFFKFATASSLGAGLFLSRTDVAFGAITGCVGCGGGPCNPCATPAPRCEALPFPKVCKPCSQGGGCPEGCLTSGEWFCCTTATQCRRRCSECNCPAGCEHPSCHCFTDLGMPCRPTRHSGDQPCTCPPLEQPVAA